MHTQSEEDFLNDCVIKLKTGSMLKLKAMARQIYTRNQTLFSIAICESPRTRLECTPLYESRSGTRLGYFRDRKHKYQLGNLQSARSNKALTSSLEPENVLLQAIVTILSTAPRPDNQHFAGQRLDSGQRVTRRVHRTTSREDLKRKNTNDVVYVCSYTV